MSYSSMLCQCLRMLSINNLLTFLLTVCWSAEFLKLILPYCLCQRVCDHGVFGHDHIERSHHRLESQIIWPEFPDKSVTDAITSW